MAASVEEIPIDRKLNDIFEEAYNLYTGFDDCVEPTNSSEFQVRIKLLTSKLWRIYKQT